MKQYFYPAIFHAAEEGGFWVSFPDLPECLTEGDTMEEAYAMAVKARGLSLTDRLHDQEELPQPSAPGEISLEDPDRYLVMVPFNLEQYQKNLQSR